MTGSQSTLEPATALTLHGLNVRVCVCVYSKSVCHAVHYFVMLCIHVHCVCLINDCEVFYY